MRSLKVTRQRKAWKNLEGSNAVAAVEPKGPAEKRGSSLLKVENPT